MNNIYIIQNNIKLSITFYLYKMPLKKCPPGKIMNPDTGRCVDKTGQTGKKLVKNVSFNLPKPKSPRKIYPK